MGAENPDVNPCAECGSRTGVVADEGVQASGGGDLLPDDRWRHFVSARAGDVRPFEQSDLADLVRELEAIATALPADRRPGSLLRTARTLLTTSWFAYEQLVTACLVALQAVEAALREALANSVALGRGSPSFHRLTGVARETGRFDEELLVRLDTARRMRNVLSHPDQQALYTPGMAYPVIRVSMS